MPRGSGPDHVPEDVVEQVRQRATVQDVWTMTGGRSGKRESGLVKVRCPWHGNGKEKDPSLALYDDARGFHCFGCGKSGDAIKLLCLRESLDPRSDFPVAVRKLADRYGISTNGQPAGAPRAKSAPSSPPPTLETFGKLKRLPVDFLRKQGVTANTRPRGIRFPYQDTNGAKVWHRNRVKLRGKKHTLSPRGKGKSWPFGCERLKWEAREVGEVYIVEGESDTLTARHHDLPALGIPGATMARAALSKLTAEDLAGIRRYLVIEEPDGAGEGFPRRVAEALAEIGVDGAEVLAVKLPAKDLSALHLEHQDREGFRQALKTAVGKARPPADRAEVRFSTDVHQTADDVTDALKARERNLYQRGGSLVSVVSEKVRADVPDGTPRIATVDRFRLIHLISQSCRLWDFDRRQKDKPDHLAKKPTPELASMILSRGEWPFPVLQGVSNAPFIRADGSICQRPGYDTASGMVYHPTNGQTFDPVPSNPSRKDAERAAAELLRPVGDFPFVSDAGRSVWLALLLSVIGRPACGDRSPAFLADASVSGSGKTLLMQAAGMIASGSEIPPSGWRESSEEMEKTILSLALEGHPMVIFDNITGRVGGAAMERLLTAATIRDRVLGSSKTAEAMNSAVWALTSNNARIGLDMANRLLMVRLEPDSAHPDEDDSHQVKDLLGYLRTERARLLPLALAMLRAYLTAHQGKTRERILVEQSKDGFPLYRFSPGWSAVIRGCLLWVGMPDPAETRREIREQNAAEVQDDAALVWGLASYLDECPTPERSAAQIQADLRDKGNQHGDLQAALDSIGLPPDSDRFAHRLGLKLRGLRGRRFDGKGGKLAWIEARQDRKRGNRWRVEIKGGGGMGESGE